MTQTVEKSAVDLKLTPKAVQQVKSLLARSEYIDHALRISVSDGGCSGFSYQLNFEKQAKPGDLTLDFEDLRLLQTVLAGGSVEHQECLMGRAGLLA